MSLFSLMMGVFALLTLPSGIALLVWRKNFSQFIVRHGKIHSSLSAADTKVQTGADIHKWDQTALIAGIIAIALGSFEIFGALLPN